MEAALVLKENSQQPWKTVEERTVRDDGGKKDAIQSVAGARMKEAADIQPHFRSVKTKYLRRDIRMQ